MSGRDVFRMQADQARVVAATAQGFDQRPYTVAIRLETYAGPIAEGIAPPTITDTLLAPQPNVKSIGPADATWFAAGLAALSTGRLTGYAFDVGPITPWYAVAIMGPTWSAGATSLGTMTVSGDPNTLGAQGSHVIAATIVAPGPVGTATCTITVDGMPVGGTQTTAASIAIGLGLVLEFAGGSFQTGDVVTLTAACGGYAAIQLVPPATDASHRNVVWMTGPDLTPRGEPFEVRRLWSKSPQSYFLTVSRIGDLS